MLSCHFPAARILLVEDDPLLACHMQVNLQARGYNVSLSQDGREGLRLASSGAFDLVLLDILLPGISGLQALQHLRERLGVPVILISALGGEQDRIAGFSQGADDYLAKPFSMDELHVRIAAVLRRVAYERREPVQASLDPQLQFDEARMDVSRQGQWAELTHTEFRLLELFVRHPEGLMSKAFLYQQVLRRAYSRHDRSLDMHISHVRRKLQAVGYTAGRLETVWGKGYLFTREGA
ncbi:response regulator transcription factor [Pseudomonas sp. LjRoot71]|uniref:response regulator transcription factor n=1 Tax=Pseudomonas sp. LjRoot71 TaxID=3342336 RepID=UPI003ECF0324